MSEKGLYSPVVRRIMTLILLIGITGSFLAAYYFIYLPQQRAQYNLRIFRILHEISSNFKQRVGNYGIVYSYTRVSSNQKNIPIPVTPYVNSATSTTVKNDTSKLNNIILSSFKGDPLHVKDFVTRQQIEQDSIAFSVDSAGVNLRDTTQLIASILEPIIAVHTATFKSILLVKQKENTLIESTKKGD